MAIRVAEGERITRYTIPFADIKEAFGLPGTVLMWVTRGHGKDSQTVVLEVKD